MLSQKLAGLLIVAVGVCALVATPTASAADSTSADSARVLQLYFQIQKLKDRVRRLQGQVETLEYRIAQTRELQKKNYQNLLRRLEGGDQSGQQSDTQSGSVEQQPPVTSGDGSERDRKVASSSGRPNGQPTRDGSTGQPTERSRDTKDSADNSLREQYMAAFDILKKGEYDKAAAAFEEFASKHPQTGLTDNAYYWRGEALYVQQKYKAARDAFVQVVNNFSQSAKVPDALYKIAVIDIRNGRQDDAKATLDRIVEEYGGSRAALLAKKKLEQLGA